MDGSGGNAGFAPPSSPQAGREAPGARLQECEGAVLSCAGNGNKENFRSIVFPNKSGLRSLVC